MDEAFGMSSKEQTGWKKRKTPNLVITNESSTASCTPDQGQRQLTHLEDVLIMMAWEILTMKQRVGA